MNTVGETITIYRVKKGLTKAKLSQITKVSPSLITKLENGERMPSTKTKLKIANALNVDIKEMFPDFEFDNVIVEKTKRLTDETYIKIGENIEKYRKLRGISLTELAELVGMTANAISNYERAKRKPPIDILKKIAIAFNINANELITIEEKTLSDYTTDELLEEIRRRCSSENFSN